MRPTLPLRIAILETDTPLPAVLARYGTYGDIFRRLLQAGADELHHPGLSSTSGLEITTYDVVDKQEYPPLDSIDAVLITGSKHDSFATTPWTTTLVTFTQSLLRTPVRLLGICYGHQIAARALHAPVGRSPHGWELAVVAVALSPAGQALFPGRASLRIHQMHQDAALALPPGVEPLGATSRCTTQGMYARGRLLTVQGHPEFDAAIMDELLDARVAAGKFGREEYEEAKGRAGAEHDGVAIAAAMLRFLLE